MGKKTRLGALGRALLVVAAAAAAVAVLAGGARAEPQAAGFDVLASLLARVKENIDATHRVTVASFQQTQEQCAAALLPVQAEIDQRQTTLNASAARVQDAENQQKSLAAQFQPLNDRIAADLLEQGKLAERVRAGDAQREAEAALVRGKVQANVDLTETVSRLVARLAAVNTTQFSFREALGDGTAASAAAAARIGEALQAGAGAPEVVVKAGDEVTVARLRTLLSLLRAELQEFQQQVGSHEEETAQAWADQRAKLAARIDELYKDAKSAEAAKDVLTAKIAEQKAIVEKEQAVLAGPLVAEVNKWNERKKAIVDGCELKRKHFEAEEKARESQQTTIQALAKLSAAHADSGSDLGIAGISIPQPALCCTKCSGATPMACGDSCVSLEVAKTSRCHVGCACGESDPRLAGLQQ